MNLYMIPDVHGQLELLCKAANWITDDAGSEPHQVVCLGDYIDRGPHSKGVLDFLRLKRDWIKLKGNHDDMLVQTVRAHQALRDGNSEEKYRAFNEIGGLWLTNGGLETLKSFFIKLSGDQEPEDIGLDPLYEYADWLEILPDSCRLDPGLFCVHAGVRPGISLEEQDPVDLMWIRQEFLHHEGDFGAFVVHGHSCTDSDPRRDRSFPRKLAPPVVCDNRLNLDGRAYSTGTLWIGRLRDQRSEEGEQQLRQYPWFLKLHGVT
jgi:serine/threonine protein phosphatase 1